MLHFAQRFSTSESPRSSFLVSTPSPYLLLVLVGLISDHLYLSGASLWQGLLLHLSVAGVCLDRELEFIKEEHRKAVLRKATREFLASYEKSQLPIKAGTDTSNKTQASLLHPAERSTG